MSSLVRDGEVQERVAEWEAAREAERQLMAAKIGSLKVPGADTHHHHRHHHHHHGHGHAAQCQSPTSEPDAQAMTCSDFEVVTSTATTPDASTRGPSLGMPPDAMHAPGGGLLPPALRPLGPPAVGAASASDVAALERRMEQMQRQMEQMRLQLVNCVDENRFLRMEVDVLRDAVLSPEAEARGRAEQALMLIGRRAGTQELRDSVCTHCLTRTRCFRCYACRSVEYCSSRCQLEGFAAHVALCRHITERS